MSRAEITRMRVLSPRSAHATWRRRTMKNECYTFLFHGNNLLAVHFHDQSPGARRIRGGEMVQALTQPILADGADLVDRDLGFPSRTSDRDAAAPTWMELGRQWTDDDRIEVTVHFVATHHDHGSRLGDFRATHWIEVREVDAVAVDVDGHQRSAGSSPSATVPSKSLQSSRSRAIALKVSSHDSRLSCLLRKTSASSRTSST